MLKKLLGRGNFDGLIRVQQKIYVLILAQSLFCIFDFYYFPPKESIILLGECVIRTLQTSERSSMISQVPV